MNRIEEPDNNGKDNHIYINDVTVQCVIAHLCSPDFPAGEMIAEERLAPKNAKV